MDRFLWSRKKERTTFFFFFDLLTHFGLARCLDPPDRLPHNAPSSARARECGFAGLLQEAKKSKCGDDYPTQQGYIAHFLKVFCLRVTLPVVGILLLFCMKNDVSETHPTGNFFAR